MYTIYKHTTPDCKAYIGMTGREPHKRWGNGSGYINQPFYEAIIEYGWKNIEHEILEEVETIEEARAREQYYIELYKTYLDEYGYNICGKNKVNGKRKVRCIETGEIFRTCGEAGKAVGRGAAAINYAILHRKPCAKLHWEYICQNFSSIVKT